MISFSRCFANSFLCWFQSLTQKFLGDLGPEELTQLTDVETWDFQVAMAAKAGTEQGDADAFQHDMMHFLLQGVEVIQRFIPPISDIDNRYNMFFCYGEIANVKWEFVINIRRVGEPSGELPIADGEPRDFAVVL